MADRKPALRIENKTGSVRDTKIMLHGKDVTADLGVQTMQIILRPDADTVRVVMECVDAEIDIAALAGQGVIRDERSAGAEYKRPDPSARIRKDGDPDSGDIPA